MEMRRKRVEVVRDWKQVVEGLVVVGWMQCWTSHVMVVV